MASNAIVINENTTVEWSADGGTTYTSISEAKSLAVPQVSREYAEVTSLDSTGGFREFKPTLKDGGELALELNYTAAMMVLAKGYDDNNTLVPFRVTLPLGAGQSTTGDRFEFSAYVTAQVQQGELGTPVMLTLNLRVTGNYTYTQGS